jgi:regulatory protein
VNYAGGKFRMNGWGRIKITSELKMKSISADLIFEALETIEEEEYIAFLKEILGKKMRLLGSNTIANRQKAAFYAASKGFEPSLINSILKNTNFTD